MIGTTSKVNVKVYPMEQTTNKHFHERTKIELKSIFLNRTWIFALIGLLFGRAIILSDVSPFSIAFIATIWMVYRKQTMPVMLATFIGAFSYSVTQGIFISLALLMFFFFTILFKQAEKKRKIIPIFVLLSIISPRMFLHSITGQLTSYEWMLLIFEGVIGLVLMFIFMQSIPILSQKKYRSALKNEEMVCMIILIASIFIGTIGWEFYGVSLVNILSRYFVLFMAYIGGAAIGSTVGVVAGLVLSLAHVTQLYQMSLLAFSGLLGGLLKEAKKIGVSGGLLVGTFLIGIYNNASIIAPSIIESCLAIVFFYLTPNSLYQKISRFIPGTEEYTDDEREYLQKVRDVTAKRVEQFSDVFEALSKSFSTSNLQIPEDQVAERETDLFLSKITEKTCQKCFMKERCWQKQFDETYALMEQLKEQLRNGNEPNRRTVHQFQNYCIKSRKVLNTMKQEISAFDAHQQLKKKVLESKRLVADQLQGVSEVMDDFANEILKEREHHERQEKQIIEGLGQLGIELEKLDIYQLEKGNVDIEMTISFYEYHGEAHKIIAPFLSDILNEFITVNEEEISPFPNGYGYLSFRSAKEFIVKTGVANAAKGGGFISGDSYTMVELGIGKYALAISDGMGSGKRAREESEETLRLLHQILQTGIPEHVAIKSINSILSLRTTDEMFSTLDLAIINLHDAFVRFLKIGSSPSFIIRSEEVIQVSAGNLPIGIIDDVDVDIVSKQLKAGDLLVMMSDGVFDGPKQVACLETWFKHKLTMFETDNPQHVADLLLEEVIRTQSGKIADDMTVVVAKIEKNIPKWSSIPLSNKLLYN